jgi:hypothetical protein
MAECITCEEEYSDKRLALGYETCLDCGQTDAVGIINARNKQTLAEIAPGAAAAGTLDVTEGPDWDRDLYEEEAKDGKDE